VALGSVALGALVLAFVPFMGFLLWISLICSLIGLILGCVSEAGNKSVGIGLNAVALALALIVILIAITFLASLLSRY